jgi:[protein-PII] uridylyltransferase
LLYLACLFHDIAKGRGGDHSQLGIVDALSFCRSQGLNDTQAQLVAWLVEHHLTMSTTAQKKDITDPQVVSQFAHLVGSEQRLIALYLLTVADVRGTSPKVWNAWKARLLESLFQSTRRILRGEHPDETVYDTLALRLEETRRQIALYGIDPNKCEVFWQSLDSVYLQRHSADEMAWHARNLFFRLDSQTPIVRTRLSSEGDSLQVMVYSPDQEQLFARICGVIGKLGYSILDAKVQTTKNNYALDTFTIFNAEHKASAYRNVRNMLEHALTEAIVQRAAFAPPSSGRVSRQLKHFPLPPQISIALDDSAQHHILDVIAGDRPGLLSRVAYVLAQHQVSIESARINTLGERAEDIFIVKGSSLLQEKERIALETELAQTLA